MSLHISHTMGVQTHNPTVFSDYEPCDDVRVPKIRIYIPTFGSKGHSQVEQNSQTNHNRKQSTNTNGTQSKMENNSQIEEFTETNQSHGKLYSGWWLSIKLVEMYMSNHGLDVFVLFTFLVNS